MYSEEMNDWQYLSQLIFPQKEILRFSCALMFNYGHVTKIENEGNWQIGGKITLLG